MAALIDTSVLIEAERGHLDLRSLVGKRDEDFFISVITASELLHGVHRSSSPAVGNTRLAFVEGILERFPIIGIDLATARAHARIWSQLSAAGKLIGMNDLWLAATCVSHGLRMITGNIREFKRVPGLSVEAW